MHHCIDLLLADIRLLFQSAGVDPIQHLIIWSDNCASQFKSKATLGWAIKFAVIQHLDSVVSNPNRYLSCLPFIDIFIFVSFFRFLITLPLNMGRDLAMANLLSSRNSFAGFLERGHWLFLLTDWYTY